jgi:hypothetical protein
LLALFASTGVAVADDAAANTSLTSSASEQVSRRPVCGVREYRLWLPAAKPSSSRKESSSAPVSNYELIFNLGYVNQVDGSSIISDANCDVRWLTGPPSGPFTNDNLLSSDKFTISASNQAYRTFGPWSLAVKEGDPGVTRIEKSLYIDLSAVISCSSGSNARFVMADIQMNPVGFAKSGGERGLHALEMRGGVDPEV